MRYKHVIFIFLFYFAITLRLNGQINTITPVSPQAASIGKSLTTPVGYYTGTPKIEIPLLNIQSRDINVPINLSYNSSGIKVEEIASWVGLGWKLSAGGAIIQQTRGLQDQDMNGGFIYNSDPVNTYNNINGSDAASRKATYVENVLNATLDTQPDLFYYNMDGYSGSFFFGNDGTNAYSVPLSPLSIKYNKNLNSWKIISEVGVQYFFESEEISSTKSYPSQNRPSSQSKSSTWYLTKIISTNLSDTVSFFYANENYGFNTINNQVKYIKTFDVDGCNHPPEGITFNRTNVSGKRLSMIKFSNGYLKFIPGNTNRQDIAGTFNLKALELYDTKDKLIKKIGFDYSYQGKMFLDAISHPEFDNNNYVFEYLYKKDIETTSFDQDFWGYYNGANNTEFIPKMKIPSRYPGTDFEEIPGANRYPISLSNTMNGVLTGIKYPSGSIENFEYEANVVSNLAYDLVRPRYTGGYSLHAEFNPDNSTKMLYEYNFEVADDNTNIEYTLRYGPSGGLPHPGPVGYIYTSNNQVVTTIPRPTNSTKINIAKAGIYKFKIDFSSYPEYVENFYFNTIYLVRSSNADTVRKIENQTGPGLRIKKIVTHDSQTNSNYTRSFEYTSAGDSSLSSGKIVTPPTFFDKIHVGTNDACEFYALNSYSNCPLSTTSGSYVGYSHVIEKYGDNGDNGKKEYFYTSSDEYPDKIVNKAPFIVESNERFRGKLLKEETYKKINNKYVINKYLTNEYKMFSIDTYKDIMGLKFSLQVYDVPIGFSPYTYAINFTHNETDINYLNSQNIVENGIESKTRYIYNHKNFLIDSIITIDSKKSIHVSKFLYPQDMIANNQDPDKVYEEMVGKNMVNIPIIEKRLKENTILSTKIVNYFSPYTNTYLPKETIYQQGNSVLKNIESYQYYPNAKLKLIKRNFGPDLVYLWSYNSTFPIAEIKNVDYSTLRNILGGDNIINGFAGAIPTDENIYNFLAPVKQSMFMKNAFVNIYIYNPLVGMTSQTDPKGRTTYYEYDDFQRLKLIKDQNGKVLKRYDYHYQNQ